MDTTPVSLIERVRTPGDHEAWQRLVELTTPLLFSWAYRAGLRDHDAADLVQDVLAIMVAQLPQLHYDRQRSFRGWLRTVTSNKLHERWRRRTLEILPPDDARLDEIPDESVPEAFWEREFREKLVARALELMRTHFQPNTWKACWEHVVCDRPAAEVADELGISVAAVYVAKGRVLRRLRQELAGAWDL